MRIPFDNWVLAASVAELNQRIGGRIQNVHQAGSGAIVLELYKKKVEYLWISWNAETYRLLISRFGPEPQERSKFALDLRQKLNGCTLVGIEQIGFDRIVTLRWEGAETRFQLIAELMGKHSNLILVEDRLHVVTAAKWLTAKQSERPIFPGVEYRLPKVHSPSNILKIDPESIAESVSGVSPFLRLMIQSPQDLRDVQQSLKQKEFRPIASDAGVYVLPMINAKHWLDALAQASGRNDWHDAEQLGDALHAWLHQNEARRELEEFRRELKVQLERAALAREVAQSGLEESLDAAKKAGEFQQRAELLLAYQYQIPEGTNSVTVTDYEGNEVELKWSADRSAKEEAARLFERAKRAKLGSNRVREQLSRIEEELADIRALMSQVVHAEDAESLHKSKVYADAKGYFRKQQVYGKSPEDRPFEGHRIKKLFGPRGYVLLLGENSSANDYLTLRIAKPNDWWFHVRGSAGAHVVLQTQGKPDHVPPEVMRYAALIAAQHSPQKHSSYVPVDYTLKKYVRRIKGGALGVVQYSHEKTLHVEPNESS